MHSRSHAPKNTAPIAATQSLQIHWWYMKRARVFTIVTRTISGKYQIVSHTHNITYLEFLQEQKAARR